MGKPSSDSLAVPGKPPLFVSDRAKALQTDILVWFHTGMPIKEIADRYGFESREIQNAIATASEELHAGARLKAQAIPRMARDRLKGAALDFAETVIDVAQNDERGANRLKAAIAGLEAAEVITQGPNKGATEPTAVSQSDIDELNRYYNEAFGVIDAEVEE